MLSPIIAIIRIYNIYSYPNFANFPDCQSSDLFSEMLAFLPAGQRNLHESPPARVEKISARFPRFKSLHITLLIRK